MTNVLLPLCSLQKVATRDGYTGPNARVWIPFFGYWFADGRQIFTNNVRADVAQNRSYNMQGLIKPNVFKKDCCSCSE